MSKVKKDYLVGGILTLMGVAAALMSMQVRVKTGSTDPGSRLFPMMASVSLTLCGIGVLASAAKSQEKTFLSGEGWKRIGISFGILILYILLLKYIGFLISTPVFLFAVTGMLAGEKKAAMWGRIVYSLVITGLTWYTFVKVLSMPLPKGVIF